MDSPADLRDDTVAIVDRQAAGVWAIERTYARQDGHFNPCGYRRNSIA
jgi:hypothetical protein